MSSANSAINQMRNNAPRPLWPWLLGATALAGGFTWYKKRNLNVYHRQGSILPDKTQVNVTKKGSD